MEAEAPPSVPNQALYKQCAELHAAASPYVRSVTEDFTAPRPLNDMLWRSALRKAYDSFGLVLQLVQEKKSGLALPLLRPMCEDLLYLVYFDQLPPARANKILFFGGQRELLESILAQSDGDGSGAWANLGKIGYPPVEELHDKAKAELAKEGQALGWRQGSYWPSVAHVAIKTGLKVIYDQIYHGTSRGVHFSPHHLLRMVWGKPGGLHSATLDHFQRYYEDYALTNVGWLFCTLIAHCWKVADVEPEDSLNQLVIDLAKNLNDFGRVPIVTGEELEYGASLSD